MKKFFCVLLCIFTVIATSSPTYSMSQNEVTDHFMEIADKKETQFNDISDYPWAIAPIKELAQRGIVKGTGNGNFSPQNTVSRYEYLKMITGVCGIVNENATMPYTDVPKDHWAYTYVASAYEAGLLNIYSKVIFNGVAPITREEIAYIGTEAMLKSHTLEKLYESSPDFTDADKISDYAKYHVSTLNALEVLNGRDDGRFSPKDFATRAEAAKILCNILYLVEINY